jgi:3-dehydroquinate synthase
LQIDIAFGAGRGYPIKLGALETLRFEHPVAVVSNPTIAGLHAARLLERIEAPQVHLVTLPDGEQHKSLSTIETLLDRLFEARFDRKCTLLAFGGGVIGDMTGFAASLYQRGIDFVQVPTTLLSMVDASVGGKTGVNNRFGKNLIGSFYQPRAVHIDPHWLTTLPEREWRAGVAEVIKMAATLDCELFEWLEGGDLHKSDQLLEAIARCVALKAQVVADDECEGGFRQVLNYGHTFGHVMERQSGFGRYLHGECVAMGMVMANRLAVALGHLSQKEADRITALLARYGLPLHYPVADIETFYELFYLDKKSRSRKILFVLPKGIGRSVFVDDAPREVVLQAIEGVQS